VKVARPVRRGAVAKVPQGNSVAAYPTKGRARILGAVLSDVVAPALSGALCAAFGGDPPSQSLGASPLNGARAKGSACPLITAATAGRRLTSGIKLTSPSKATGTAAPLAGDAVPEHRITRGGGAAHPAPR